MTKKTWSFSELLEDEEACRIIEAIEEIDEVNEDTKPILKSLVKELKQNYRYTYTF